MYWYWWAWLGAFVVPEFVALGTGHPENTFSDFVWKVCDVLPGQTIRQWTWAHYGLAVLMLWLPFHFVFRMWAGRHGHG